MSAQKITTFLDTTYESLALLNPSTLCLIAAIGRKSTREQALDALTR